MLEAETADLKAKLRIVLAKTANDDKLIAALRAEVGLATAKQQGTAGSSAASEGGGAYAELVELRQRYAEQEEQASHRQGGIREGLEREVEGHQGWAVMRQRKLIGTYCWKRTSSRLTSYSVPKAHITAQQHSLVV